jgi:hypothetical protein
MAAAPVVRLPGGGRVELAADASLAPGTTAFQTEFDWKFDSASNPESRCGPGPGARLGTRQAEVREEAASLAGRLSEEPRQLAARAWSNAALDSQQRPYPAEERPMFRTRSVLVVLCLGSRLMLPANATAQDQAGVGASSTDTLSKAQASGLVPGPFEYRFPSGRERFKDWALNAFGPSAVAGSMTSAAWGQWVSDEPQEWLRDGKGYAKRFGVASATTAITESSLSLLSAAMRQDQRYYRCPCAGLGPRLAHSLKMTFMARRPDGSAELSVAKTVSPFIGPLVTRTTLYPDRYDYRDGVLSGAYAVLMNGGWNLAREFVLKAPRW